MSKMFDCSLYFVNGLKSYCVEGAKFQSYLCVNNENIMFNGSKNYVKGL